MYQVIFIYSIGQMDFCGVVVYVCAGVKLHLKLGAAL